MSELNRLTDHLIGLYRLIRDSVDELAQQRGWTFSQLMALRFVGSAPDRTMHDLASHLRVSRAAVTSIADRLEAEGLLARRPGSDRRMTHLRLTPEGESALRALRAELQTRIKGWLGVMPGEAAEALTFGLEAFDRAMRSKGALDG